MPKNFTMEVSDENMARLERLRVVTEAPEIGSVISSALRVYEAIIDAAEAGGQVLIKKDGTVDPLPIFEENG